MEINTNIFLVSKSYERIQSDRYPTLIYGIVSMTSTSCLSGRAKCFFMFNNSKGHLSLGGSHPLDFVTTCDNGVINGGLFMHLSIFFPALFVDMKQF